MLVVDLLAAGCSTHVTRTGWLSLRQASIELAAILHLAGMDVLFDALGKHVGNNTWSLLFSSI